MIPPTGHRSYTSRSFSKRGPACALGTTGRLPYLDADGTREFGEAHSLPGCTKGRAYPTVFIIYEDCFADTWDAFANLLNVEG